MSLYEELCNVLGSEQVLLDEPMSRHTTFRIGGPADYFVVPRSTDEIKDTIEICKNAQVPYYILGNGSNLLVGDKGYRGVVIQIYKNLNEIHTEGNLIHAQAGALLSKIAAEALGRGLEGFEFASGIPGTLGGAVMMNAGAYGGEMKQVLLEATVLTQDGEVKTLGVEELELGYRTSIIAKEGYVVLEAAIGLKEGDAAAIRAYMEELKSKRVTKQPLEYPSAGSTFKRPEGYFAGKLIEDAGLRGFRVGNAQVSEKHCGFVINRGGATAAEVVSLMEQVADKVEALAGVRLEPEVKRIGEF
ncbi:MAG: UDP-N-acetylmuramate dehydrogenase [Faecalicatena sp.]|uniref:UDP-N-acetylmuramate dehydrogenase n=1 Tax=Faecalicatena sp. TaxID=2005360 RepID=UPI00258B166B|nr:UDP-N-acetylmuramate dehydrogenase [Faecalicatena sp.]MCI6467025.1 UDP-N-acetylmuramate dehydrogenase [Faecalicatena sp.]MDY5617442.1 UDP-N-acetylmuramate dehydrogenase [Lachnospiraceae bacterium]